MLLCPISPCPILSRKGWQVVKRVLVLFLLLTTLFLCPALFAACDSDSRGDFVYENEKFGFSLNLPGDFAEKVEIREDGNFVYFVAKEVQAAYPEQIFGVIGRIEIYDKREITRESLKELEDMYGFKYLGESVDYYFGWAHATDVQVPPDASEKTEQDFRALEKEFDAVIESFSLKKSAGEEPAGTTTGQNAPESVGEYSLISDRGQLSLRNWYDQAELSAVLGEPVAETNEVLGREADTHAGSHLKTLKYEGLVVQMFSPRDNGKDFWLMSMDLTSPKLQTTRGITVGSPLTELKEAYTGLEMVPDGRSDPNNCAYWINRERYEYMTFEVEKGIIKEIKLYVELP
jgi:hypothetical protein